MNKEVLAWDLYHMLEGRPMYSLRDVPVRFSSVDEYLDVFEPLLLEECRAQTLRTLNENEGREHHLALKAVEPNEPFRTLQFDAPPDEVVKGTFVETDLVFVSHEQLDLDALEESEDGTGAGDGSSSGKGQQFHALAIVVRGSETGTLVLKVYLPEEPTNRLPPSQHRRLQLLRKVMVPASGSWYVRKLGNMVTINREFQALYSLRDLPLASMLLAPGGGDSIAPPPSLQPPPTLLAAIEATHNPSQLVAIRTCLCGRGVTLIQGPPGTGKTKTILGILSVLLASRSSQQSGSRTSADAPVDQVPKWTQRRAAERTPEETFALLRKGAPWLATTAEAPHAEAPAAEEVRSGVQGRAGGNGENATDGDQPTQTVPSIDWSARGSAPAAASPQVELPPLPFPSAPVTDSLVHLGRATAEQPPKHVLVCTPSNAAIDEIVARLLQHTGGGMLNARGEAYVPSIVRVGPNVKESLMEVSLDTLARARQNAAQEGGEAMTYDAAKTAVLNEASIVCTTLSCAGYSIFSQLKQGFDTVLIDEAAQAVEMSTLIPLKYACRRLILVGDPNQLPATVFSDHATKHNYEQSLFQRLQIGGQRVAMLTTQYRMHPDISRFPAQRFYHGALRDAPRMAESTAAAWHSQHALSPYVFFDVTDGPPRAPSRRVPALRTGASAAHPGVCPRPSLSPCRHRTCGRALCSCPHDGQPTEPTAHPSHACRCRRGVQHELVERARGIARLAARAPSATHLRRHAHL